MPLPLQIGLVFPICRFPDVGGPGFRCLPGYGLGDKGDYVAAKLKEIESKLRGLGTKEGKLEAITPALAAVAPLVAQTAIHYSLQAREDWLMSTHLLEETRTLAESVDRAPLRC